VLDLRQDFYAVSMSKLKDYLAFTGILLGLDLGNICLAQNASFPQDVTIRRSNVSNSTAGINQYLVYASDPVDLIRIKTAAPDAFIGSLDSGQKVVQIGRFNNLDFAQKRVEELRRLGIDAKVQTAKVQQPQILTTANPNNSSAIPISPSSSAVILPDVPYAPTPNGANNLIPVPSVTTLPAPPSVTEQIGRQANGNRYFVIIPSTVAAVLDKARTIVPTAKLNSSDRGTYIEVQGYPDRSSADTLNATMRSQGLDSRVIYF